MGNKNYKSSNKAKIVKWSFQKRRYKPNQLFARLKQKLAKSFLLDRELKKNWKFKLRRA